MENENKVNQNQENYLDNFTKDDEELVDLTTEKINDLNKKLPSWSIEPPEKFLRKK
ncbi:MAG: hypothetical protein IJ194_06630 [Bacilli bacterium]|nr:hypothetical protein [Bacilli bacterium]